MRLLRFLAPWNWFLVLFLMLSSNAAGGDIVAVVYPPLTRL